jgi:hypothetical protein
LPSAIQFSKALEGSKIYNVTEIPQGPKYPQNLLPISFFSTTGKLFKKVIPRRDQRHIDVRGLLNGSQFGFRARHSMPKIYEIYRPHQFKFQQ